MFYGHTVEFRVAIQLHSLHIMILRQMPVGFVCVRTLIHISLNLLGDLTLYLIILPQELVLSARLVRSNRRPGTVRVF